MLIIVSVVTRYRLYHHIAQPHLWQWGLGFPFGKCLSGTPKCPSTMPKCPSGTHKCPSDTPKHQLVHTNATLVHPSATLVHPSSPLVRPRAPVLKLISGTPGALLIYLCPSGTPKCPRVKQSAPLVHPSAPVVRPNVPLVHPSSPLVIRMPLCWGHNHISNPNPRPAHGRGALQLISLLPHASSSSLSSLLFSLSPYFSPFLRFKFISYDKRREHTKPSLSFTRAQMQ